MAFSLDQWKGSVSQKDFLRPTNFELTLVPPFGDFRELRLRTESVTAPGIAFLSADNYRPYGNGLNLDIPYSMNITEMTCTHLVDSRGDLYRDMFEWANLISNIKGDKKFSANYFKDYVSPGDARLVLYARDHATATKVIIIKDVYPKSIDQMQLSWATTDEIVRLNVTYFFSHYRVL
jgi:hypothetical protein